MTEELAGFTLEAVDALIESVGRREGIIAENDFQNERGCCTLGSLGYNADDEYNRHYRNGILRSLKLITCRQGIWGLELDDFLELGSKINKESESFEGTLSERRKHMLKWFHEQRAFKCCDWVPAPKERVPARHHAHVLK